jgi:hypothetical protein
MEMTMSIIEMNVTNVMNMIKHHNTKANKIAVSLECSLIVAYAITEIIKNEFGISSPFFPDQ